MPSATITKGDECLEKTCALILVRLKSGKRIVYSKLGKTINRLFTLGLIEIMPNKEIKLTPLGMEYEGDFSL